MVLGSVFRTFRYFRAGPVPKALSSYERSFETAWGLTSG